MVKYIGGFMSSVAFMSALLSPCLSLPLSMALFSVIYCRHFFVLLCLCVGFLVSVFVDFFYACLFVGFCIGSLLSFVAGICCVCLLIWSCGFPFV